MLITLLILLTIFFSGLSTVPLSVGLIILCAVLFKRSLVFFLAFGLGLYLDLAFVSTPGQTSLVLSTIVFLIKLYERKFEIRTANFVFMATTISSIFYLWTLNPQMIFLRSLGCAVFTVIIFKIVNNLIVRLTNWHINELTD